MTFTELFIEATGNKPFPWQHSLFKKFAVGDYPSAANIPTGLGKTSVVVIWLIALALHPKKTPRRLIYVVNRRTVVDQTTAEVEKIRKALIIKPKLKKIADKLLELCALPLPSPDSPPLAISTLRGQYADNREWSTDPSRPAVIIGTVDMIGSGLLFSRYTVGFKLRPHHAAFLAQDVLLVHDEAHLEPAFQILIEAIFQEQNKSNDQRNLRVMALSATTRSEGAVSDFKLTEEDQKNEYIQQRLHAVKKLKFVELQEKEKEQDRIIQLALKMENSARAVLIFVRSVETALKVTEHLKKKVGKNNGLDRVLALTGTMRGQERDELVSKPSFQYFFQQGEKNSVERTVWLVATSAGEVGINISAFDLICDVSTFESMAQRFGRINRFGVHSDSTVTVVHPQFFGKKNKQGLLKQTDMDIARERTLVLLKQLQQKGHDVSPACLEKLSLSERVAAFSPLPRIRTVTPIQFDAWALTSIRKPMAARPPVAPYLHGETEWQPPETYVAWREEIDFIRGVVMTATFSPEDLLDDYPLKPHELLRDTSKRIAETLSARIEAFWSGEKNEHSAGELPAAWLIGEDGDVQLLELASIELVAAYKKGRLRGQREKDAIKKHKKALETLLADSTLILPASFGGIDSGSGLFTADAESTNNKVDVSAIEGTRLRFFASSPELPEELHPKWRLIRVIDTEAGKDEPVSSSERYWLWIEAQKTFNRKKRTSGEAETLAIHSAAVFTNISAIAEKLFPSVSKDGGINWSACLQAAAHGHDSGKNREHWQLGIGNINYDPDKPDTILAKSGGSMRPRNTSRNYRHEFGALNTMMKNTPDDNQREDTAAFSELEQDIILHLIAAHHGRARPHFPDKELMDCEASPDENKALATEVPQRFARLQSHFGRWGLAWLESILRSADYSASAGIVASNAPQQSLTEIPIAVRRKRWPSDVKTFQFSVDVTNPGQYFSCCGLFELATRLIPDLLGHFKQDADTAEWRFIMTQCYRRQQGLFTSLKAILNQVTSAEILAIEPGDKPKSAITIGPPFNMVIDWWRYEGGTTGKLKTWAGQMSVCSIAKDMQQAMKKEIQQQNDQLENLLFLSSVANKGQPYYFDSNYAVNAKAQDVGFSIDKLGKGGVKIKTVTMPVVEFLCLIGLQRARPVLAVNKRGQERLYDYCIWNSPLPVSLIPAAVEGFLPIKYQRLRFANAVRAKDYRAFMSSVLL